MKGLALACTALLLTACSSVVMQEPFSDSRLTPDEMKELRGTWQLENDVIYLDFTTNGSPVMTSVEWTDDRHTLIRHDLHIARRDGAYFFSLKAEPGEEPEGYLFAAFRPRHDEIVVWGPDVSFFEALVRAGKLKGSVKKDRNTTQVALQSPAAEILDLIATNRAAIDYEEPLILRQLD